MAPTSPNLRVRISADLTDIKQGLGLLRGELSKLKADASGPNFLSDSLTKLRGALGPLAAVATVGGLEKLITSSIEVGDELNKGAIKAGIAGSAFSELAHAAKMSDIDIDTLSNSLRFMQKNLSEASTGAKAPQEALAALGLTLRDLRGLSADKQFELIGDRISQLKDPADKARAATDLFGKSGANLLPMFEHGAEGIRAAREEAQRLGTSLTDDQIKNLAEADDAIKRMKASWSALATTLTAKTAPALTDIFNLLRGDPFAKFGNKVGTLQEQLTAAEYVLSNLRKDSNPNQQYLKEVEEQVATLRSAIDGTMDDYAARQSRSKSGPANSAAGYEASKRALAELTKNINLAEDATKRAIATLDNQYTDLQITITAYYQRRVQLQQQLIDLQIKAAQSELARTDDPEKRVDLETRLTILQRDRQRAAIDGARDEKKALDELNKAQAERLSTLDQDRVKRAITVLDQQFQDEQTGIAKQANSYEQLQRQQADIVQYYQRRIELQEQLIDLQITQANFELAQAKTEEQRQSIEQQLTILQRDRQQAAIEGARDEKKALEDLNKTQAERLGQKYSNLTGGLSATESSISAQIQAGTLGMVEGEKRLQEARQSTLEQLQQLRPAQEAYLKSLSTDNPEFSGAQQALAATDTAIANVIASLHQLRQGTEDAGVNALTTFFTNLRDGAMSAGAAFRQLVLDFAKGVYDMVAQVEAKRLVGAISGLFGSGSADVSQQAAGATAAATIQTTAATTSATILQVGVAAAGAQLVSSATIAAAILSAASVTSVAAAHSGGTVGALRLTRNDINPIVFGAAPRYHGGGIAGLQNDEIPAILKRGEVVRTKQQERALAARMDAGSADSNKPAKVIVVFNDDDVATAMSGSAGEKVTIAHVRRNRRSIDS